jgi:hypothetical protein
MTKFALLEDALATLDQHGLAAEIEQGVHFKIKFINAFGSQCCLVVSRTPSNRWAIHKNRAVLRRLLLKGPAPPGRDLSGQTQRRDCR